MKKSLVLSALLLVPNLFAADRFLSLDTGYRREANSNRAWENFGSEWVDGHAWLYDTLHTNKFLNLNPQGELLAYSLFSLYTMDTYAVAFHEFGHGTRLESLGYRTRYRSGSDGDTTRSPWLFFLHRFAARFDDAYAIYSTSDRAYTSPVRKFVNADGTLTNDGDILVNSGGMNNSMRFAGALSDRLRQEGGHWSESIPYFISKLDAAFYPRDVGDLHNLDSFYALKGVRVSETDMRLASVASFLLSQSTYAYLVGAQSFVENGDPRMKAFAWNNLALPDVENYLTTRGLSWKISSGYRFDETIYLPFAIEAVSHGKAKQEYTLGVRKKNWLMSDSVLDATVTAGSGLEFGVAYTQKFYKRFAVAVGWDHFNGRNLHGERNAVSYKSGFNSDEVWARLSFVY